MDGDITRTFRLNPRSQLAITEYKRAHKLDKLTINKIVNTMLQEVGSVDWLEYKKSGRLILEAKNTRIRFLENKIREYVFENGGGLGKCEEWFEEEFFFKPREGVR